jgi:hypothetical protein
MYHMPSTEFGLTLQANSNGTITQNTKYHHSHQQLQNLGLLRPSG